MRQTFAEYRRQLHEQGIPTDLLADIERDAVSAYRELLISDPKQGHRTELFIVYGDGSFRRFVAD